MKLTKQRLKEIIKEEILSERYLNLKSIKHSDKKIAGYMKQFQKLDDILQKIDMIDFTSHLGKEGHNKAKGAGNKILDLKRSLYDELKNLDKNLNEGKMIKEELLNERMNFDEKEYVKRIAGHFQTGIILQKMARQMEHENRTETEHKVLDMSLGKYLKMLKKNFKL